MSAVMSVRFTPWPKSRKLPAARVRPPPTWGADKVPVTLASAVSVPPARMPRASRNGFARPTSSLPPTFTSSAPSPRGTLPDAVICDPEPAFNLAVMFAAPAASSAVACRANAGRPVAASSARRMSVASSRTWPVGLDKVPCSRACASTRPPVNRPGANTSITSGFTWRSEARRSSAGEI